MTKDKKRSTRKGTKTGPTLYKTRWNKGKRKTNNLTRDVRYFKYITGIVSDASGNFRTLYEPDKVSLCTDFENWARNWSEFKVLNYSIRAIPRGVGSESVVGSAVSSFQRGDIVTFVDQGPLTSSPTNFPSVIVKPSAKVQQPRNPFFRKVWRPNGLPNWGGLGSDGIIVSPDEWQNTTIQVFGTRFSPQPLPGAQVWYFVTVTYQVLFRARQTTVGDVLLDYRLCPTNRLTMNQLSIRTYDDLIRDELEEEKKKQLSPS